MIAALSHPCFLGYGNATVPLNEVINGGKSIQWIMALEQNICNIETKTLAMHWF